MKITHQLAHQSPYRREFRILLIGSGGNGSNVLFGLPYLHHALVAWGRDESLSVTVMDGDLVSPTNCVRQPFGAADVGQSKATILVNRINLFHGLAWRAEGMPSSLKTVKNNASGYDNTIDLVISCVDTRAARREMHEAFHTTCRSVAERSLLAGSRQQCQQRPVRLGSASERRQSSEQDQAAHGDRTLSFDYGCFSRRRAVAQLFRG